MRVDHWRIAGAIAALSISGCGSARTVPGHTAGPYAATVDFAKLAGRWTVSGVAITGGGVQAFAPNDPAYVGQTVIIAPALLSWDTKRPSGTATLADRCTGPVTARQAGASAATYLKRYGAAVRSLGAKAPGPAHAVECSDGQWGPEASGGSIVFPIDATHLAMSWYDNVVLKLTRATR